MEFIDVVDENNQLTGEICERKELHEKGLWFRSVFVLVMNEENELLIQKRAPSLKNYPNMWGITAGHVTSGESELSAALRETEEELGIKGLVETDFELLCVKKVFRSYGKKGNNHFKYIYLLQTNLKQDEFVLQREEVSEVKYCSIDELKEVNQNKETYQEEFQRTFFDSFFLEILEDLENRRN